LHTPHKTGHFEDSLFSQWYKNPVLLAGLVLEKQI